jgi:hypothetical protein
MSDLAKTHKIPSEMVSAINFEKLKASFGKVI